MCIDSCTRRVLYRVHSTPHVYLYSVGGRILRITFSNELLSTYHYLSQSMSVVYKCFYTLKPTYNLQLIVKLITPLPKIPPILHTDFRGSDVTYVTQVLT